MIEPVSGDIAGTSLHCRAIREFVGRAATEDGAVTLLGEPGVGKELVARRIHRESSRAREPFLMIDCSLYYERELRREIYGYRGVGAAAKSRKGLLEFASEGTLYLARAEELTPALQQGLHEFLRTRRFRRLGDGKELGSSVRLFLSSDKNLEGFVHGGLFCRDLWEDLAPLAFRIEPLRDRPEDVEAIVAALLERHAGQARGGGPVEFTGESLEALRCFPWPRNADDLLREVQRVLDAGVTAVRPQDLSFEISSYWLGQCGDPEVRRVVDELDAHIREFKVLSRLDAEFGDGLVLQEGWESPSRPSEQTSFGMEP